MDVALKKFVVKKFVLNLRINNKILNEGVTERLIVADCKSVGFPS